MAGAVCDGTKKDIRNAVEAARGAVSGWRGKTGYNRAQILMYIAENMAGRGEELKKGLIDELGCARS